MDRPDIVLLGIPVVVVSGHTTSAISHALGAAGPLARSFQVIGYAAAAALICWAVWNRVEKRAG